jgi:hypothetical protein
VQRLIVTAYVHFVPNHYHPLDFSRNDRHEFQVAEVQGANQHSVMREAPEEIEGLRAGKMVGSRPGGAARVQSASTLWAQRFDWLEAKPGTPSEPVDQLSCESLPDHHFSGHLGRRAAHDPKRSIR